ncbi:MAPK regulated corepressor interacting protein 2-like [Pempheris klunzingeri]|uniref:MAPK regulated corepressor interacting protein 2-like n=1 Tax=Pempheris klunzingeri TaxID=3127111 RepID=UPI00397F02A8
MMYTITRGPSKLVTQRRTGPTQQLDNKMNDFKHKQTSWSLPDLPAPKIVFNRPNGKKYHHPAPALPADTQQEESFTAAHEENVSFVYEAWQEVQQQQQQHQQEAGSGPQEAQRAVHYKETTPSPRMDNFVPLDLDEWWAQRFLANIDKLS